MPSDRLEHRKSLLHYRIVSSLLPFASGSLAFAAALLTLAVACGADDAAPVAPTTDTATEQLSTATAALPSPTVQPAATPTPLTLPAPPPVDTSISSVPLEAVVFDTFDGGFTRLSEASAELIEGLRDRLQPIYQPVYEESGGGEWLRPGDLVIGYEGRDAAYAYPIKILNFNELVNDVIDGVPILVSYCPLCASGVVYDRRLDDEELVFGNTSALYQNDLVMFDHGTGSYWFQVGGEAIVGTLTGRRLRPLPSTTMPWEQWKELHPETLILSRNLGLGRRPSYEREPDPFTGYEDAVNRERFFFPVDTDAIDGRLRSGEYVISVLAGGLEKAYAPALIGNAAVNDTVGGEPVVVFSKGEERVATAFSPVVRERTLTFVLDGDRVIDEETGSTWDFLGRAVEGELAGEQLELLPSRSAFWFSISLSMPDVDVYEP